MKDAMQSAKKRFTKSPRTRSSIVRLKTLLIIQIPKPIISMANWRPPKP